MVELDINGTMVYIRFPFSPEQVNAVKSLTSDWRKRDSAWLCSVSRLEEIYAVFHDAKSTPKLIEWIELQRKLARIKDPSNNSSPQPHWVACELLGHQRSAVEYLDHLPRCANFDPPGAGKTRVAAAWAGHGRLPALIICPAAVKFHWRNEIVKCYPDARPVVLEGNPKAFQGSDLKALLGFDWVILNYDLLRIWLPLLPPTFNALIIDESQTVINSKSQRGAAILQSCAHVPNVHYMTGSPIVKRPSDLESMLLGLSYLSPKERFAWRVRFCAGKRLCINEKGVKYHGKEPEYRWDFSGASNIEILEREIQTFSVKRPPEAIQASMPSKPVHTLLEIDLPDMREHNQMWREMKAMLKSKEPVARGQALALMGKMLRWCAVQKHDTVLNLVTERLDNGESPVVFADFHEPLDRLRAALVDRSLSFDGRLTQRGREAVKEMFIASPEPRALLACRPGTGTGTDGLQRRARTVVFQSLPWAPAYFEQAYKRVYREGQTKPVEVITTLARGTAEEAVLEMIYQRSKVTDIICSSPALTPEAKQEWEKVLGLLL